MGGCFPCRSYGAWINLLLQIYKHVAPNPESLRGCAVRLFNKAITLPIVR